MLLLAFALATDPLRAQDTYQYDPTTRTTRPIRSYSMPPALDLYQQQRWQQYQRNHAERESMNRRQEAQVNAQAFHQMLAVPLYSVPQPPPPRPDDGYGRPRRPPVMREFKDDFTDAVDAYVRAHSRGKDFVVDDGASGKRYHLRLTAIRAEKLRKLSTEEAVGSADFETVEGPKTVVEMDFWLAKEDASWEVTKAAIRSVSGRSRYNFDSGNRIVAPAPKPAAAPARAIPKPTAPAHLSADIAFKEPSGHNALYGGQTGQLVVKLSNAGPGPAYAVRLVLDAQQAVAGLSVPSSVELGDLAAGKSLTREVDLVASEELASGQAKILLSITEGNGFDTQPVLVDFETRPFQAARLEVAALRVSGGGTIKAGEPAKIEVVVRNAGQGTARGVTATLELGSKDIFMSGESSVSLSTLEPNATRTAEFEFFVNKRLKAGQALPVSVTLTEEAGGSASKPLGLVLGQGAPQPKVVSVKGAAAGSSGAESVDVPPSASGGVNRDAYAVVVGIGKYRDVTAAGYAARDAAIMHSYLTQAMGFDQRNVVLLQNERATLTDLTTYLGPWLKDRAGPKSKVFVYFAGHGAPDPKTGQAYLVPYDGDPAYPETKAFALDRLYQALSSLLTDDIMVVLDSCFSGSGGRSLLAKGLRPLVHSRGIGATPENAVLLAASQADQVSTDHPETQHGMLTYFVLKGLSGGADLDANGRVTTKELFEYVRPAVEREARKLHVEQQPVLSPAVEQLGKKADRVWLRLR